MVVTPSELAALALARHQEPWNWTFQAAGLCLLCPALFFHSFLFLAAALIFLGAGFFRLQLGPPPDNRWFRLVHNALEWEKNWLAAPWNRYKIIRFAFVIGTSIALTLALWTREAAALALLLGFAVLARVAVENKQNGIDP